MTTPGGDMTNPDTVVAQVHDLMASGQVFQAHDTAAAGLDRFPQSLQLALAKALALTRTGAVDAARTLADQIAAGVGGSTQMRALAEIHLAIWQVTHSPADLQTVATLYQRAERDDGALPNAFGAAVANALLQDRPRADSYARRALLAFDALPKPEFADLAMQGIARAVLGDTDGARAALQKGQALLGGPSRDTVPFVRILNDLGAGADQGASQGDDHGQDRLAGELLLPRIAVFTGHELDRPDADTICLPAELEADLQLAIREQVAEIDVTIGYSLPRCGSDILFIEALLARGAEVHIILPYNLDDFIAQSVTWAGPGWETRVRDALGRADSISYATAERFLGHEALNRFANQYLHGLALLRAAFLQTEPFLIAVWDMREGSLPGGAADFIDQWEDISRLRIVDLDMLREDAGIEVPDPPRQVPMTAGDRSLAERDVRALLFADIVGFSRLEDDVVPQFLDFYDSLFTELKTHAPRAATINTWGDAFFIVMDDATQMVEFGLAMLAGFRAAQDRFGQEIRALDLRVSLHAGPVFSRYDPFRKGRNYYGAHINRAARLEPVTIPGQIYATQQFVALLTVEETARRHAAAMTGSEFTRTVACDYVGVVTLAKNFGKQAVYHIRRR